MSLLLSLPTQFCSGEEEGMIKVAFSPVLKRQQLVLTYLEEAPPHKFKVLLTLHPYPTIKQLPRQPAKDCKSRLQSIISHSRHPI